ncbi:TOMM precursor leader peptide-binding protein [Nonomuraea sp. NPDC050536]|uniref:TOMM precursor leader peptide-binding protein n=1 Tax=Nonomuraea sp. NPDC050536 TaxID=3364366 RepID=UPI0037C7B955
MPEYRIAPYAGWVPLPNGLLVARGTWYAVIRGPASLDVRDQLMVDGRSVHTTNLNTVLVDKLVSHGFLQTQPGVATYRALLAAESGVGAGESPQRTVTVLGASDLAGEIAKILAQEVEGGETAVSMRTSLLGPVPAGIVVVVADGTEFGLLAEVNRRFCESDTTWLFVDARASAPALIGPLFTPGVGCLECHWMRRAAVLSKPAEYDQYLREGRSGSGGHWQQHMIAGLAAALVLDWVSVEAPRSAGTCLELAAADGPSVRRHTHVPVPGCAVCGGEMADG